MRAFDVAVIGGKTARMALARLLMRQYKLLILDGSTAAIDMESTLAAERLISDYCRQRQNNSLTFTEFEQRRH